MSSLDLFLRVVLELILFLQRFVPPAAVRNLTVANVEGKPMQKILKWTNPTKTAKGAPFDPTTQIKSIEVFDVDTPDPSDHPVASVPGPYVNGQETFTMDFPDVGFHNVRIVVTDTNGNASAESNIVSFEIVAAVDPPAAVTDLTVEDAP